MHRHHPYGASGFNERRRSASPGARLPRSERGAPRGFSRGGGPPRGRGRGGGGYGGGYDSSHSSYDSYTGGGYDGPGNGFGSGGGPPSGYPSTSSYGGTPPPAPYARDTPTEAPNAAYDSFSSNYRTNNYEDGYREVPPAPRRREDKIHDKIIEERINRERPCRTLFVRNIKYESDSQALRRQFEEHGAIRTFFDLISSRGMVFVTFYDLRAAQAARERLQGIEVTGRPIDVHYSLPRPEETEGRADRDKHQGTLLVTLRNSQMNIDENELRRKFQPFGDIKNMKSVPGRPDQRYIEMFDTRATEDIHDNLAHAPLQDGIMDLSWTWDILDEPVTDALARSIKFQDNVVRGRGGSIRGGRGGFGPGRGGPPGGYDDFDRRDRDRDYRDRDGDRDRDRNGYGGPGARDYEEDRYTRGGGPGPSRGGPGGYRGGTPHPPDDPRRAAPPDPRGGYSRPEHSSYGSSAPPPSTPMPPQDDRLEQARKVQQLLAALKNPAEAATAHQQAQPFASTAPRPFVPNSNAAYPPPPPALNPYTNTHAPPPAPPSSGWGAPPPAAALLPGLAPSSAYPPAPSATQPQMGGGSASLGGLPPAVLALLQQGANAQQQPPNSAYLSAGASAAVGNPQAMQNLLALLASQQKPS